MIAAHVLKKLVYLFTVTEAAIETGSRRRTNEAHASLTELGEKRVVLGNVDVEALGVQQLGVVQELALLRAALDPAAISV